MCTNMFQITFRNRKIFFMTGSQGFVSYFIIIIKNYTIKFKFLEN